MKKSWWGRCGNILQSPRMVFKDNFFLNSMDKLESSSYCHTVVLPCFQGSTKRAWRQGLATLRRFASPSTLQTSDLGCKLWSLSLQVVLSPGVGSKNSETPGICLWSMRLFCKSFQDFHRLNVLIEQVASWHHTNITRYFHCYSAKWKTMASLDQ